MTSHRHRPLCLAPPPLLIRWKVRQPKMAGPRASWTHLRMLEVVISALAYYLQTWCISYKGPVFAAMFSPLQVIIVALFSAIAFAERLHFGSLIGAFLIIAGLYCVLWGKRKDNLVAEQTENGKGVLEDIKVLENDISVTNPVTRERT